MRDRYHLAVVTNDIYTQEDAQFLVRSQALEGDLMAGGDHAQPDDALPREV